MTKTVNVKSAQNPDVATGVAQFLSPVVVALTALSVDTKQAHWHVRGSNFQAIHELLDEVVAHARDGADEVAERIVALGLPVDARIQTVAAKTNTPAVSAGFAQSSTFIAEIIQQIDAVLEVTKTAVDELDDIDLTSQDIAIALTHQLEKDRWFLFAHIAE